MLRLAFGVVCVVVACHRASPPPVAPPAPAEPSAAGRGWYLQAVVAEERGDREHADRAWAWVARMDDRVPHAVAHRARYLQREHRWPEAANAWHHALRVSPGWWEPMAALGALAFREGRLVEAELWWERAIAAGADGEVYDHLIRLLVYQSRLDDAARVLQLWLARSPDHEGEQRLRVARSIALWWLRSGRPDPAPSPE